MPLNDDHCAFSSSLAAQLFSEVSLHTLLSYATSPSPALPKLLSAVEQHTSPTPTLSNAAHTLSLPLLHTILVKMREASSELRSSAVATLCKASHSYTHTTGDDAQVDRLFVAICIASPSQSITSHIAITSYTSPLHHHYITITSPLHLHITITFHYITITSPLHQHYITTHQHYITITSPLHHRYTIIMSPLHFAYTITLQLHPCIFTICSCHFRWLTPCDCSLH